MNKLKPLVICFIICIFNFTKINALDYNYYCNTRFNYNVSYPKNWTSIKESDNGDGAILYNDNENDIRIYASNYSGNENEEFNYSSTNSPIENFIIINKEEGVKILHYTLIQDNVEYNLYAKTKQEFYTKEKESIFNIIKSFHIYN